MSNLPASTPKLSLQEVEKRIQAAGIAEKCVLVGIRGYYLDSMGKAGQNDRGIYDDAIFLVSPTHFLACNANVDPSAFRTGIATLNAGLWLYKIGIHGLSKPKAQQYKALVQAKEVTVSRDNQKATTGFFGINIHRGGVNTTSSLGCQTIPPKQWPAFIASVEAELSKHGQKTIPYLLSLG